MKTVVIVIILCLPVRCFSQLQTREIAKDSVVGKIVYVGFSYAEITCSNYIYRLTFRNFKYPTIFDFESFSMNTKEVEELYSILSKNMASSESREIAIDLYKEYQLRLYFKRHKVELWLWDGYSWSYSFNFSKRQIAKLFNKNN